MLITPPTPFPAHKALHWLIMASQEDPDYAGVVDAFNSLYVHVLLDVLSRREAYISSALRLNSNYCNVAVIGEPFLVRSAWKRLWNDAYNLAFLVFDWLLGLRWEISLFWKGASIGATTLYVTTRYMTLLENVLYLIQFSQVSGEVS